MMEPGRCWSSKILLSIPMTLRGFLWQLMEAGLIEPRTAVHPGRSALEVARHWPGARFGFGPGTRKNYSWVPVRSQCFILRTVATPLSSPRGEFLNWISSRFTANPLNPDEIAVAFQGQNNGGVLSSTDAGTTWLLESAPPTRYSAVGFAPDGTLYAISSGPSSVAQEGLYRRENNGSWTPLGPDQGPLFESDLNTMRFSLNNADLILLGGSDFGVAGFEGTIWRSTDAGLPGRRSSKAQRAQLKERPILKS